MSDLRSIKTQLGSVVGKLDPDAVPLCRALDLWCEFDDIERFAASAKTLMARRVEAAGGWRHEGYRSVAEQLAARAGTSVASARSMLETSQRVAEQPKVEQALRAGELSSTKVELVSSAAEVAPAETDRLLDLAKTAPVAKVKEEGLRAKASVGRDETHARIRRERELHEYTDAEGAWVLRARGPAEAGAAFRAAITPIIDEYFKRKCQPEDRDSREALAFDALVELATGQHPVDAKQSRRYLGLVRVDLEAMQRGAVEGDELCEISGLGPIPVPVAKELLGDAVLKLVITKGVDVANVTHLGRAPTVAQKAALWWRSPTCDVLGCSRTQRLEIDHETGWAKTHTTRVDDSNCLCDHHHDLKTYFGWAMVEGTGPREMVPPDDPRHPKNRPK